MTAAELDAMVAVGDSELLQELAGYGGDGWGVREMTWLGSMKLVVRRPREEVQGRVAQ